MKSEQQEMNNDIYRDEDIRLEHNELGQEVYVFDPYNPQNK